MKKTLTEYLGRRLVILMWLGAGASVLVHGIYFFKFAPGQWFTLSDDPQNWGVLGDFVGGLLNPFFSFLAFIGVLITVLLQARQLEAIRTQASIEELQRLLASVASNLDGLLNTYPTFYTARSYIAEHVAPMTLFNHIAAFGTRALNEEIEPVHADEFDHLEALEKDLTMSFGAIGLELQGLAWVLEKYQAAEGSPAIIEFYKFRYLAVTCWLDGMGYLAQHNKVLAVFEPNKFRKIFAAGK